MRIPTTFDAKALSHHICTDRESLRRVTQRFVALFNSHTEIDADDLLVHSDEIPLKKLSTPKILNIFARAQGYSDYGNWAALLKKQGFIEVDLDIHHELEEAFFAEVAEGAIEPYAITHDLQADFAPDPIVVQWPHTVVMDDDSHLDIPTLPIGLLGALSRYYRFKPSNCPEHPASYLATMYTFASPCAAAAYLRREADYWDHYNFPIWVGFAGTVGSDESSRINPTFDEFRVIDGLNIKIPRAEYWVGFAESEGSDD